MDEVDPEAETEAGTETETEAAERDAEAGKPGEGGLLGGQSKPFAQWSTSSRW